MRIWLINPYGPLPSEGWREYSFVVFGEVLSSAGHEVIWWTSNFSHHFKRFRSTEWQDVKICNGFTVRLVPTSGYRRNIGVARIIRDLVFSARTYLAGRREDPPHLVLYAESPLCFGLAGPALAAHHGAALIYDQMDLWPELIVRQLPRQVRPIVEALLWPIYQRRRSIYRRLDGVIALAKPYLDAVLREIQSDRWPPSVVIYNGVAVEQVRNSMRRALPASIELEFRDQRPRAIFAGSLGPSYDIPALLEATELLAQDGAQLHIYIAGDGPCRELVSRAASRLDNLTYLEVLDPSVLAAVYGRCDIGLACYSERSNVEMPDKFYDYTAAGLAIVNSLAGEVAGWIDREHLGLQYIAGNAASLAEALRRLGTHPESLRDYRDNAYRVASHFDRDAQHRGLLELVSSLAGRRQMNGDSDPSGV